MAFPPAPKSPKGDFLFLHLVIGYWILDIQLLLTSLFLIRYSYFN
jgi:hypothetical protein